MLFHDSQELDDDLRRGTNQDLTLALALSVANRTQAISQNAHTHHILCLDNIKMRK